MKFFNYLVMSFLIFSCSNIKLNQDYNFGSHITRINDGEGYIYFDLKYDSITLINLSESLSKIDNKIDTCFVYVHLTALKDSTITKDSIKYSCNYGSFLPENRLNEFFLNFNPKIQGDIGINPESYKFILPFSFSVGLENLKQNSFRIGKRKEW
jgi:hypothetical protein